MDPHWFNMDCFRGNLGVSALMCLPVSLRGFDVTLLVSHLELRGILLLGLRGHLRHSYIRLHIFHFLSLPLQHWS